MNHQFAFQLNCLQPDKLTYMTVASTCHSRGPLSPTASLTVYHIDFMNACKDDSVMQEEEETVVASQRAADAVQAATSDSVQLKQEPGKTDCLSVSGGVIQVRQPSLSCASALGQCC